MKWTIRIVRSLLGLLLLFASITYFAKLITPPPMTGAIKAFDDGLRASRYLVPLVKAVELTCGLAFLSGRFVPLATVLYAPIVINILGVNVFLAPEGLPVAIFMVLATALLAWHHRESYRPLFKA
ncbi:MAG TPA: hypothetical protein VJ570_09270 [Holophagaceae bacterium]|nr:hypothetical protein [Holophagaceae bacterium]